MSQSSEAIESLSLAPAHDGRSLPTLASHAGKPGNCRLLCRLIFGATGYSRS